MDIPSPVQPVQPTQSVQLAPGITHASLIQDKRKRNIVIGSVIGGLVAICIVIAIVYLLVFRPRVYFGNHILITTIQTPTTPDPKDPTKRNPSGTATRYTLAPNTRVDNATAVAIMNNQTSCMLVTPKLEHKGLAHQGDTCLIWEPLSNTYLYTNTCGVYNDTISCTNSAMGHTVNECKWVPMDPKAPQGVGVCQGDKGMSSVVFRTLPKNFVELLSKVDPTNHSDPNYFLNGFLFQFVGTQAENKCPTTPPNTRLACNPIKTEMLRVNTNYAFKSNLTGSYIVEDLIKGVHNQGGPYNPTFNWQFMK